MAMAAMMNGLWFDVGIKRYTTCTTVAAGRTTLWFDVGIKRYTTLRRTLIMLSRLWLMSESRFLRLEKAYMPKAGWIFLLRKSNLPLAYHINCKDSARRAEKKSHGQKNKPPVCCG